MGGTSRGHTVTGIPDELCRQIADYFVAIRGGLIDFTNIRSEDRLSYALHRAGLFAPVSDDPSKFYPLQRVSPQAESEPLGLSLDKESKRALLDAAICFAGDVQNIPVTRSWFQVSGSALGLVRSLASFGYAERHDDEFRWTDQIGPSMRTAYFWDDEGRSVDDRRDE